MANWIIKLGSETKATGSGNNITYNFPPNGDGSQQEYTISYTSDTNCTASTTYTVPACTCSCDEFTLTGATNIPASGASWGIVTYDKPSCDGSIITATTNVQEWVTSLSWTYIDGTIMASVIENTSSSPREGTCTVTWSGGGLTCTKTATFRQEGKTCTCEDIMIHENALIFKQSGHTNYEEDYYEIYLVAAQSECKNSVTVNTNGADWLTVVTYEDEEDNIVYWTPIVQANNTYFSRETNVTISINGVECESVKVIQNPKCEDKTYHDTIYLSGFSTTSAWPSDFKLQINNGNKPSIVYANETYLCEYVGDATPFTYEAIRVSANGGTDYARVFKTEITHPKTNHTAIEEFTENDAGTTITDDIQISAGRNNGEVVSYDFPDKALITWSGTTYELPKIDDDISNESVTIKYRLDNIDTPIGNPLIFLQITFTFSLGGESGCQTSIDLLHGID
jgi:hypothetical protein